MTAGTLSFFVYTQFFFKKPIISEKSERTHLMTLHTITPTSSIPILIPFPPITTNIEANPPSPLPAASTLAQIQGKLHYATIGFSIEIRDANEKALIESLQPHMSDQLIHMIGKKQFHELTQIQGRYILRAEFLESINQLIYKQKPSLHEPLITHVYFTEFIVQ